MGKRHIASTFAFSILITGCSQQAWYDTLQNNGRDACHHEPPATQQECRNKYEKTYKEHQREIENLP